MSAYEKLPANIKNRVAVLHAKHENLGKRKIDKIIYRHLILNQKELKRDKRAFTARNNAYLLKKGEVPILEYFLDVINLYRKFLIVKGIKKLPLLVKIYVKATIDGLLSKF